MLIVLIAFSFLLIAAGIFTYIRSRKRDWKYDYEPVYYFFNITGGAIAIISIIAMVICLIIYSNRKIIDDKIDIYRVENEAIEQKIDDIVLNYKDYEQETFDKITNKDPITLITLYPELKSDELITKQMEIYISNNQQIKDLQVKKLSYRIYAWWIFFG